MTPTLTMPCTNCGALEQVPCHPSCKPKPNPKRPRKVTS